MTASQIVGLAIVVTIGLPLFSFIGFAIVDLLRPDERMWNRRMWASGAVLAVVAVLWVFIMIGFQVAKAVS